MNKMLLKIASAVVALWALILSAVIEAAPQVNHVFHAGIVYNSQVSPAPTFTGVYNGMANNMSYYIGYNALSQTSADNLLGTMGGHYQFSSSVTANVYLGNDNKLDRPVFIIEGYDVYNEYGFSKYWNDFNFNIVGQSLLDTGRDIVFINFANGANDIFGLARYTKYLIHTIGKIAESENQQMVVAGVSMGGLVARIALKEMEDSNFKHNTSLYITYDTPHRGANLPIDIINHINHMEDKIDVTGCGLTSKCRDPRNRLRNTQLQWKSTAGKQMLITSDDSSAFYSRLEQLGHPENLRKVAFSNGNGFGGKISNLIDGNEILNFTVDYAGIIQGNNRAYSVKTKSIGNDYKSHYTYSSTHFDAAPGGTLDSFNILREQLDDEAKVAINADSGISNHSFVPTVSALDLNTTNVNSSTSGVYSPFDKTYHAGTNNLKHTNLNFHAFSLLSEINTFQ